MSAFLDPLSQQAALLNQVIGSSTDLIYLKDCDGTYIACNTAYGDLYNQTPAEIIGNDVSCHGDPELSKGVRNRDSQVFETGTGTHHLSRRIDANGNLRWIDVVKTPLFDVDGTVSGLVCIARDITRQHNAEMRLKNQNAWLDHLNAATIAMIRAPEIPTDVESLIGSIAKLTETTSTVLFMEPPLGGDPDNNQLRFRADSGKSAHPQSKLLELAQQAQRTQSTITVAELGIHLVPVSAEGARNGVLVSEWETIPSDDTLALVWTVARQLAVLLLNKTLVDDSKYRANHDDLTGLANRRHLIHKLDVAMTQRDLDGNPVAVIFGDLDGFKQVNDKWGHHRGDLLLQLVAKRLKNTIRKSDTLARLGGDEFAFVVPNGDRAICAGFLERITKAVADPFDIGVGEPVSVGLSIGFAQTPEDGMTATELMIAADKAMYENKSDRRELAL